MITLKAVLVGSSCIGALAIGGVTYATVANPHAGLRSDEAKLPAAQAPAAPALPAPPKCLPQQGAPALPEPGQAGQAARQQVSNAQQQAGSAAGKVRQEAGNAASNAQQQAGSAAGKVRQEAGDVRNAPVTQPRTLPKNVAKPGVPGTDCLDGVKNAAPAEPAAPAKPEAPQLPQPAVPSCDSVQPAVPAGSPLERSVILSRGLGHATKQVSVVTYKSQKLCAVTQKWVGNAGQWLKIERIKTPAYFGVDQAREALRLPEGGAPTTVSGQRGLTTPLGGAVLWYDPEGFAMYLSGSPAYMTQLQDVAAKVQQAAR